MIFEELKIGLQMISPQGDIFEVCAISNSDKTVLVKVNEFATKNHGDEDPMDNSGREFTGGNSGWITEHGKNAMRRGFYEVGYQDLSLWRGDDIPEFETGDFVKDLDGNIYRVAEVDYEVSARYYLELLEFSSDFIERNADRCWSFEYTGQTLWIYNTQNDAVLADDYTGIYQLFATELKLTEYTPRPAGIPAALKEAKRKRPSIEEIRELTEASSSQALDKLLDEIYALIHANAKRGEHAAFFTKTNEALSRKLVEYFRSEGFTVNDFEISVEIKW